MWNKRTVEHTRRAHWQSSTPSPKTARLRLSWPPPANCCRSTRRCCKTPPLQLPLVASAAACGFRFGCCTWAAFSCTPILPIPPSHPPARTLNVDVDGEMGVHQAHLVLVALGHAGDHVLIQRGQGGAGHRGGQVRREQQVRACSWAGGLRVGMLNGPPRSISIHRCRTPPPHAASMPSAADADTEAAACSSRQHTIRSKPCYAASAATV